MEDERGRKLTGLLYRPNNLSSILSSHSEIKDSLRSLSLHSYMHVMLHVHTYTKQAFFLTAMRENSKHC